MKSLILLPFLYLTLIQSAVSATFIPISYDEQIRNSDAVVHAVYKGKTYKKVGEGQVVTVNSFQLVGSSGITHSGLINKNNFKIITPGGEWNGRSHFFTGSPQFEKDEEVVLFLKKHSLGFRVMNLSLGKYEIEQEGSSKYLKNSVFPEHPRMKPIRLESLQEKLVSMGKEKLADLDQRQSYVAPSENNKIDPTNKNKPNRSPASTKTAENKEEGESPVGMPTLFVILVLAGFLFRYVSKKLT